MVQHKAQSNSGSTFATENDLVLPDLRDHAVLPLLLSIVPEIEELDAHSKLAESTRNAWPYLSLWSRHRKSVLPLRPLSASKSFGRRARTLARRLARDRRGRATSARPRSPAARRPRR